MVRPAHGTLRLTRTALLAGACSGLAWGGHNQWAETPAGVEGFLLATVFLLGLLWPFTKTMRGFGDIFVVMAFAQVASHLILQVMVDPGVSPPGHDHGGHGPAIHLLGFAPGMLFAHLWAALLASALLAHGESALWFLAGVVSRALPRPLRATTPPIDVPGRVHTAPPFTAHSSPAPRAHMPRGPPGSLAPHLLPS